MTLLRWSWIGLLLQSAIQACLAGTVHQIGAARVYSTVGDDGVILFTNIPRVDEAAVPGTVAEIRDRSAGSGAASAHGPASHDFAHAAKVRSSPPSETQADAGPDDQGPEEISPERRDGGPPPEDH